MVYCTKQTTAPTQVSGAAEEGLLDPEADLGLRGAPVDRHRQGAEALPSCGQGVADACGHLGGHAGKPGRGHLDVALQQLISGELHEELTCRCDRLAIREGGDGTHRVGVLQQRVLGVRHVLGCLRRDFVRAPDGVGRIVPGTVGQLEEDRPGPGELLSKGVPVALQACGGGTALADRIFGEHGELDADPALGERLLARVPGPLEGLGDLGDGDLVVATGRHVVRGRVHGQGHALPSGRFAAHALGFGGFCLGGGAEAEDKEQQKDSKHSDPAARELNRLGAVLTIRFRSA